MPNPSPSSKLRELREAATPGEWEIKELEHGFIEIESPEKPIIECGYISWADEHEGGVANKADANLIVWLRNNASAIEGLIEAAEAFAEQISRSVVMAHNPGGSCSYCDLRAALNALRGEA